MNVPLVAAVTGVAVSLGTGVMLGATALHQRATLAAAVDSAALAAADTLTGYALVDERSPCSTAHRVLDWHGAILTGCRADIASGSVRVTAVVHTVLGPVTARARAGTPQ